MGITHELPDYTEFRYLRYRMQYAWQHEAAYVAAEEWVGNNSNIAMDNRFGGSYINGHFYASYIIFKEEEDVVVFKLKFPSLPLSFSNYHFTYEI